ncbi:zinc ribbon domain-containing protein [Rhodohalobacter sp. 8-1]|uniref:zinc ribbon domain-containing protein n=1 Tax=Rhodohalobacter sp. 8-1 TaxID=3131972 RepID=UPI00403F5E9B
MKKIKCPGCAVDVDADSEQCPICGYEFPKQSVWFKVSVWILILLTLSWVLL